MTDIEITRMNWSRPAAMRTWAAIMHAGGQATTRRIQQQTQSMAVHTDITSLRILLATDFGLKWHERMHYVKRVHLPARESYSKAAKEQWATLSPSERRHAERDVRVVLYVLRGDVRRLWPEARRQQTASGAQAPLPANQRVARPDGSEQQEVLFEHRRTEDGKH